LERARYRFLGEAERPKPPFSERSERLWSVSAKQALEDVRAKFRFEKPFHPRKPHFKGRVTFFQNPVQKVWPARLKQNGRKSNMLPKGIIKNEKG